MLGCIISIMVISIALNLSKGFVVVRRDHYERFRRCNLVLVPRM